MRTSGFLAPLTPGADLLGPAALSMASKTPNEQRVRATRIRGLKIPALEKVFFFMVNLLFTFYRWRFLNSDYGAEIQPQSGNPFRSKNVRYVASSVPDGAITIELQFGHVRLGEYWVDEELVFRGSETSRRERDERHLAIASVICFTGGVSSARSNN